MPRGKNSHLRSEQQMNSLYWKKDLGTRTRNSYQHGLFHTTVSYSQYLLHCLPHHCGNQRWRLQDKRAQSSVRELLWWS